MSDAPQREAPAKGVGTAIAEVFGELGISGILQPGIIKSVSHLIFGIADIPVAYMESFADDIRSTKDARRHLRMETARSISEGFGSNSGLSARAYAKNASQILREQVNTEDVLGFALEEMSNSHEEKEPDGVPDDDWLAAFGKEAAQRSSEEMKHAFGRILAGEIQSPGTYSIRSVRALGMMDTQTAALFRNFCNLVFSVPLLDSRIITPKGNAAQNALQEFGLPFSQLNVLQENGLIISDFNSWLEYSQLTTIPIPMSYAGRRVRLRPMDGMTGSVKLHGVALTSMGRELYNVVDLEENKEYSSKLIECFARHKIDLQVL